MQRRQFLHNGLLFGAAGLLPNIGLTNELFDKSQTGIDPLLIASYEGQREVIKTLIQNGADVNTTGIDGTTPLHLVAAWNRNLEMMQFLVSNGASVNVKDNSGYTPLHIVAMYNEHIEGAQFLVSQGANINAEDNEGARPIDYAKAKDHEVMFHYLSSLTQR